nr:hypothetical protein [Tanacetum cinerariifolium]
MYQNLNQLQWKLERDICHGHNSKTCLGHDSMTYLVVFRTLFKEFFDLKEYLEKHDKLIDERVLKYGTLRMREKEIQTIKEIEKWLKESEMQKQDSSIIEGAITEDCLVTDGVDIGPSYESDTVSEVPHDMFANMFENMVIHGIQNHVQPETIPDTYVVNENNSHIIFDIPNMDLDRDKEEHDDVNREAQQAKALLTIELERYKEKEKHFAKDMATESEYCKKIKLLNDEISYLKS